MRVQRVPRSDHAPADTRPIAAAAPPRPPPPAALGVGNVAVGDWGAPQRHPMSRLGETLDSPTSWWRYVREGGKCLPSAQWLDGR